MSKFGLFAVAFLLSSCAITSARAEVVYQFSGTTIGGGGFPAGLPLGFTTIVPDFFTPANSPGYCPSYGCILPTQIVPGTCVGCDPEVVAPGGVPTVADFFGFPGPWDSIAFFINEQQIRGIDTSVTYPFYFPMGSFSVPGTYQTFDRGGNPGTLTVTEIMTETPEPSTLSGLLLLTLGAVPFVRRTRSRT